jgi:hypothetical protein
MTNGAVVLDSGVLDQASSDRRIRLKIQDLVQRGRPVVIPTVVLAEATTGRPEDAPANQTINRFGTVTTNVTVARRAGVLRNRVVKNGNRRTPSGVDAIVAAHAVDAAAELLFTTDPADLRRLLIDHPKIRVEKP